MVSWEMSHSFWLCPPNGLLNMNFDGSFIREYGRRGFKGVIKDSSGQFIKELSGMVDCSNVNEAEMYAMLMGCRKLLQLDAFDAIVRVDSFCAIQWGSSPILCP